MPYINGYSIYVAAPSSGRPTWTVRVYRDSDDTHVYSAEDCSTLAAALNAVDRVITADHWKVAA